MERRDFLKQSALAAAGCGTVHGVSSANAATSTGQPIARRPLGKTGESLSIIGMGGIVVMNVDPSQASNFVAEAVDRGINYFDVAPSYGNAQERLGPALAPYRKNAFWPAKRKAATQDDSRKQLEESLTAAEDRSCRPLPIPRADQDGRARPGARAGRRDGTNGSGAKEGKIRFIGFSAHSARRRSRRWIAITSTRFCFR